MTEKESILSRKSKVSLREVTRDNLRAVLNLSVAVTQRQFVALNSVSIAQAHFYPDKAWFRAIYADETPVGFLMLSDNPEKKEYFLWRLMVDEKYQGMSFGRQAMHLLFEHVKTRPDATEILTSCVPGEKGPFEFYKSLGFDPTGEVDEGETVMRRDL